ncbi:hypothetical protein [Acinetobacter soli]|uniref:hypothetical protein n=1 Tax=Acinetobacter soli TaxID=487316 RepID=UPI00124FFEAC|nr:hypothetical protein [Acinetobacter soli]
MVKQETLTKAMQWLANGQTGQSSKAMMINLLSSQSIKGASDHPWDPSDFRRCLLLLQAVPEFKEQLILMAGVSDTWAGLVERWDEIEQMLLSECFSSSDYRFTNAPKTYALMKQVIKGQSDEK